MHKTWNNNTGCRNRTLYFKPPTHIMWHGESRMWMRSLGTVEQLVKFEKPGNSWWIRIYTKKLIIILLNKKGRGIFFHKKWKEDLSAEGRLSSPTFSSGLWSIPLPYLGSYWGRGWGQSPGVTRSQDMLHFRKGSLISNSNWWQGSPRLIES